MTSTREKTLILLLVCTAILGGLYARGLQQEKKIAETFIRQETHFQKTFGDVSLVAKAAYVYDIRAGAALFARHENERLPLASLTKIMTALAALEKIPENAVVTIDAQSLLEEGDSGLYVGEKWQLAELAKFTLVSSSNDGARAISRAVSRILAPETSGDDAFIAMMNETALRLGLTSTTFTNPSGLDAPDLSSTGGESTAREMTMITTELMRKYPDIFGATTLHSTSVRSLDGFLHTAKNTNIDTDTTQLLLASKTGFTDLAGGNLTIIFSAGPNHPVAITVLGSTEQARFSDVSALLAATMRYITEE